VLVLIFLIILCMLHCLHILLHCVCPSLTITVVAFTYVTPSLLLLHPCLSIIIHHCHHWYIGVFVLTINDSSCAQTTLVIPYGVAETWNCMELHFPSSAMPTTDDTKLDTGAMPMVDDILQASDCFTCNHIFSTGSFVCFLSPSSHQPAVTINVKIIIGMSINSLVWTFWKYILINQMYQCIIFMCEMLCCFSWLTSLQEISRCDISLSFHYRWQGLP